MELYGYHPPYIASPLKGHSKFQVIEYHLEHQQEVLQILKDSLVKSKNRMKQQVDQHCSERSFEEGDWVFLRLQHYKQMSLKQLNQNNKLEPKYYGPYKMLQNIGSMYYKLKPPISSWVHAVFNFSFLKKLIIYTIQIQNIFLEIDEEGKVLWEPKKCLKQGPRNYKLGLLLSISSNGRTYQQKV